MHTSYTVMLLITAVAAHFQSACLLVVLSSVLVEVAFNVVRVCMERMKLEQSTRCPPKQHTEPTGRSAQAGTREWEVKRAYEEEPGANQPPEADHHATEEREGEKGEEGEEERTM